MRQSLSLFHEVGGIIMDPETESTRARRYLLDETSEVERSALEHESLPRSAELSHLGSEIAFVPSI